MLDFISDPGGWYDECESRSTRGYQLLIDDNEDDIFEVDLTSYIFGAHVSASGKRSGKLEESQSNKWQITLRNADQTFSEGDYADKPVQIKAGGNGTYVTIFTGFISMQGFTRKRKSLTEDVITLVAYDQLERVSKVRLDGGLALTSYKVCDTVTPAASLFHFLAGLLGWETADIITDDIDITIPVIEFNDKSNIRSELQDLVRGYRGVLYVDEDGKLVFTSPYMSGYTNSSQKTFSTGNTGNIYNIDGKLVPGRADRAYLDYNDWEDVGNTTIYKSTQNYDQDTGSISILITPGAYWPPNEDGHANYAELQFVDPDTGDRLIADSVDTPSIGYTGVEDIIYTVGGVIEIDHFEQFEPGKVRIRLHNTGAGNSTIKKLTITGDAWRLKSKVRVEHENTSIPDDEQVSIEIPGKYHSSQATASSVVYWFVSYGSSDKKEQVFVVDWLPYIREGCIITLNVDGSPVSYEILEYKHKGSRTVAELSTIIRAREYLDTVSPTDPSVNRNFNDNVRSVVAALQSVTAQIPSNSELLAYWPFDDFAFDTDPNGKFDFAGYDDDWTGDVATLTPGPTSLNFYLDNFGGYMISADYLNIDGTTARFVLIRVKSSVASSISGWITYSTDSHIIDYSYYRKNFASPSEFASYTVIAVDMWKLTVGGNDWKTNTIKQLQIDFDLFPGESIDIDYIYVGNYRDLFIDSSLNALDITNYETIPIDGVSGKARQFYGAESIRREWINRAGDFTVSFWFYADSVPSDTNTDFLIDIQTPRFSIGLRNSQLQVYVNSSWRGEYPVSSSTLYHVCVVVDYSNTEFRIYINGERVYIEGVANNGQGGNIAFGSIYDGSSNYFNGWIDEARIYSKILTPKEVRGLYQNVSLTETALELLFTNPVLTDVLYAKKIYVQHLTADNIEVSQGQIDVIKSPAFNNPVTTRKGMKIDFENGTMNILKAGTNNYSVEIDNQGNVTIYDSTLSIEDDSGRQILISPSTGMYAEDSNGNIIHDLPNYGLDSSIDKNLGHLYFHASTSSSLILYDSSSPAITTWTDVTPFNASNNLKGVLLNVECEGSGISGGVIRIFLRPKGSSLPATSFSTTPYEYLRLTAGNTTINKASTMICSVGTDNKFQFYFEIAPNSSTKRFSIRQIGSFY